MNVPLLSPYVTLLNTSAAFLDVQAMIFANQDSCHVQRRGREVSDGLLKLYEPIAVIYSGAYSCPGYTHRWAITASYVLFSKGPISSPPSKRYLELTKRCVPAHAELPSSKLPPQALATIQLVSERHIQEDRDRLASDEKEHCRTSKIRLVATSARGAVAFRRRTMALFQICWRQRGWRGDGPM